MKYITPSETSALVLLDRLPSPQKRAAFKRLLEDPDREISDVTKTAACLIIGGNLTKKKRHRSIRLIAKRKAK